MAKWGDYSFARPTIAELKSAGLAGVLRYLAPDDANNGGKILRPPERDSLLGAGVDIALNWEWYSGRCLAGYAAGVDDGKSAAEMAKFLTYPPGKTIYFSHDTGAFSPQVEDYFRGVRVGLAGYYALGAYGSFQCITDLHSKGLIDKGWQTLAWSNGQRDPWAVIYQDGSQILNGRADIDQVTSADIGSWLDGVSELSAAAEANIAKALGILEKLDQGLDPGNGVPFSGQAEITNRLRRVDGTTLGNAAILANVVTRIAQLQASLTDLQTLVGNITATGGSVDVPTLAQATATATANELEKRLAN